MLKLIGGKLHRKILLMMLLIGVVPIVLSGFFTLYSVTKSHRASVASIQENLVNQKIEQINSFINTSVEELELRIGLTNVDKEFRENLDTQINQLIGTLNSNAAIREASFIETSTADPYVKNYGRETTRIIRGASPTDGATVIRVDSSAEKTRLRDQRNLPQFIKAKDGERYVGKVYFVESGPMITLSAPVKSNNSENVFSVLSVELSLASIDNFISNVRLGAAGYVYVVDNSGRVIAPKKDYGVVTGSSIKNNLFGATSGVSSRYLADGVSVVGYAQEIPALTWGVIAEWPTSDADLILNNLRMQIIGFSIAALLGVILLSLILANKIVKPIKALEAGTENVAKGKFDEPVKINTNDEIEELGEAFNKMTDGLKQLQALKDEFVFIAAHELKTPVAAIKGYLSIINDGLAGPVSDPVKGFIVKVLNANSRLIRLVEDLLEVARSEAGRIQVDVVKTDITPVVNETLSELKPLADEKSINMIYTPFSPTSAIMGDNGRIREVLVNLIGNAIKYTVGNGSIEISHEVKDGSLVTHIKDHGLGISKDAQAKLFTKFYRVATKDTATISGTGLGLFIVKQIIEKMNGTISVESTEGQGSIFSFSLPLAQKEV